MKWRRGLLLAGIHLAVAVPMIVMMEARDQKFALTADEIMAKIARDAAPKPPEPSTPKPVQPNVEQEEEAVAFDPCGMWVHYPAQVVVLQAADLPSLVLAGWEDGCPLHWSLAGRLRGKMSWPPTPLWIETQRKIDVGLCLCIAIQWFLMGGFPFRQARKWWADPGAFITACAVLAGGLALLPVVDYLARLPALIAILSWFWWAGLLAWRMFQFGWKLVTARRVSNSS